MVRTRSERDTVGVIVEMEQTPMERLEAMMVQILERVIVLEGRGDRFGGHDENDNGDNNDNESVDHNQRLDNLLHNPNPINQQNQQPLENLPKMSIPSFKRSSNVDEYLEWKDKMERFFRVYTYT